MKCLFCGKTIKNPTRGQKFCRPYGPKAPISSCKARYNQNNSPKDSIYFQHLNSFVPSEIPDEKIPLQPISTTNKPAIWARHRSLGSTQGSRKYEHKIRKDCKKLGWVEPKKYRCYHCQKEFWSKKQARICPTCSCEKPKTQ